MKKKVFSSKCVLTAVMAAAMLCAACGCQNNGDPEPGEAVEAPGEPGTWRHGEWARVAILDSGDYRVQQATTRDVNAVGGLLKNAGAIGGEPIVVDAPAGAGLAAVQTLRAAIKAHGFALVGYRTGPMAGAPEATSEKTFRGGFLSWAAEQGLDTSTAAVVLTGEVVAADYREEAGAGHGTARTGQGVTIRIQNCLKLDRQGVPDVAANGWLDPAGHRWLATDGGDGLWPGDKVLILLEEYEGALAIAPRTGGGCRLGVRLSGWDDPAIEAVRYAIAEGMDKALSHETYGPALQKIGAVVAEDVEQGE
ncbi:MAG: hypothetical protein WCK05_12895 [Planctomycetota bacterium]